MIFNIKTKNEFQNGEEIQIIRTDIFPFCFDFNSVSNDKIPKPYFFIRNHLDTKNYRISISFEYLNKNYGLDIGIIRNFDKINLNSSEKINFFANFNLISTLEINNSKIIIMNLIKNNTSIFLINKTFENISSETLVYFSKDYSNINTFLENNKNKPEVYNG